MPYQQNMGCMTCLFSAHKAHACLAYKLSIDRKTKILTIRKHAVIFQVLVHIAKFCPVYEKQKKNQLRKCTSKLIYARIKDKL